MADPKVTPLTDLADDVGLIVFEAKSYARLLVKGSNKTIAYSNPRRDGAYQLDFLASDLEGIAAKLKAEVTFRGERATILVNGAHVAEAKQLLAHVAKAAA